MGQPTAGTNGAVGALTTSGVATYPATTSVGQLLWMFLTSDSSTIPNTFTGWTEYGTLNTSGSMSSRKFYRYADGTEGGTTVTITGVTGGTMGFCWIASVNRSGSGFTIIPTDIQIGTDTTSNSTAYSAAGAGSWTTQASDLIVSFTVHKATGTLTGNPTGGTITSAGSTLGTNSGMFGSRNAANSGYTSFFSRPVTTGGAGAPGQTFTTVGSNVTGHSVFIILRESASSTIDTAGVGSNSWGGVAAVSAAAILAASALGSLTWGGVQALSGETVTHTAGVGSFTMAGTPPTLSIEDVVDGAGPGLIHWAGVQAASVADAVSPSRLGALAWSGVRALSATDAASTARIGSAQWVGVRAASTVDATSTAGLGTLHWSGVRADSTALAGGTVDTARVGAQSWGGVRAQSQSDVIATGRIAGVTWSGLRASSVVDLTSPTRVAGLAWSGVGARSTVGLVDTAKVGTWTWSGVSATSAVGTTSAAQVGQVTWSGMPATSVANSTPLVTLAERTLTIAAEIRTLTIPAESRTTPGGTP